MSVQSSIHSAEPKNQCNTFFYHTTAIIFFSPRESPLLLFTVRQLQLTGHRAIASALLANHRAIASVLLPSHSATTSALLTSHCVPIGWLTMLVKYKRLIMKCKKLVMKYNNSVVKKSLKTHLGRCKVHKKLKAANDAKQQTLVRKKGKGKDDGTAKGIEKLSTITVDNASANTLAISYVKKKLANWCGISMVLNVKYVRSSPTRLQKFKTCVDREKISCGGLMVLDVPTLWNSTYLMLKKAITFEKAFDRLKEEDYHFTNWFDEDESEKKRVGPPTDEDWENAKRFNMLLIVANVLDPRCKLDFVIWCFSSLYDIRKVDELRVSIKE
ncbi:hypothetical protein WN944_010478 [Citrus x changshan-huyou]|uniref:hAT-like transposase RNase-H fold domain-containing protein n=1 Tax=Citrus x changshan-huyou TaxID=2935761 RepID=A0AAP0MXC4_9ROSI